MSNFKLKSFLCSIIVLTGMLLSACNGSGGGGTVMDIRVLYGQIGIQVQGWL